MHILILPSEYFITKERPTAGIFQFDQAKIFIEKGNRVGVIAIKPAFSIRDLISLFLNFFKGKTKFRDLLNLSMYFLFPKLFAFKNDEKEGINIIRFVGSYGLIKTKNPNGRLGKWIEMGDFAFRKYVKIHGKPDIIHAHNVTFAGMMGYELSKKHNIPFVLTERSSEHIMRKLSQQLNILIERYLKLIPNINAVSPSLVSQLENKYSIEKNKITWFPNVIDKIFENIELNKPTTTGKFVFLNVANLIPIKGQIELIKSFAIAFKDNPNVILKIGGRGHLKESLNKLIIELNLSDKVELIGFLSRGEVLLEMEKCNVLVLPSRYETFGVVLIEALALGKPVIASKCGGPECIINDLNGLLFETESIEGLTKSFIEMYSNYSKYDGKRIRNDLIQSFGKEVFYRRIKIIYQNAVNDNNS